MNDRENLAGSAYIGDSREVKSTHTRTESFSHEETGNTTKRSLIDISLCGSPQFDPPHMSVI